MEFQWRRGGCAMCEQGSVVVRCWLRGPGVLWRICVPCLKQMAVHTLGLPHCTADTDVNTSYS